MILLGISIFVLLFLAGTALGGNLLDMLPVFWDTHAVAWVFLCVFFHVLMWGRPYFLRGLKALVRLPKVTDPEVAGYFRRLTVWTLGVGVVGMVLGSIGEILLMRNPFIIGGYVAFTVFTFFYAAGLALMLFWPISVRFSEKAVSNRFPMTTALLALAAFFLTRAAMAMVLISLNSHHVVDGEVVSPETTVVQPEDLGTLVWLTLFSWNPGDWQGNLWDYLNPIFYWDAPSFILILLSLWAFLLAAGKPKNRFEWIPVSVLFGVFWSIDGTAMMLCDLDPDKYGSGCMVALLTSLYGLVGAVFFAIGSKRLAALVLLALFIFPISLVIPTSIMFSLSSGKLTPLIESDFVFLLYSAWVGVFLGAFLLTLWGGIKKCFGKPFAFDKALTTDEEEARRILDNAVETERKKIQRSTDRDPNPDTPS